MYTPPSSACSAPEFFTEYPQRQRAECVYRGMTLAAMLLLLASLWVF